MTRSHTPPHAFRYGSLDAMASRTVASVWSRKLLRSRTSNDSIARRRLRFPLGTDEDSEDWLMRSSDRQQHLLDAGRPVQHRLVCLGRLLERPRLDGRG